MNKVVTGIITSLSALAVGFGVAFGLQGFSSGDSNGSLYTNNSSSTSLNNGISHSGSANTNLDGDDGDEYIEDYEDTPIDKLVANIMSMDAFHVVGGFNIWLSNASKLEVDLDLKADIEDFDNLKFDGSADFKVGDTLISADFGYFDSTIYLAYIDNYYKLTTSNLFDFVAMIPDYGLSLELPDELIKISLDTITQMLSSLKELGSGNDRHFDLALTDDFILTIKTDDAYNFKGLKTNQLAYKNNLFSLDLDVETVVDKLNVIKSPTEKGTEYLYKDFKPALDMIRGFINTFGVNQNTLRLEATVDAVKEEVTTNLFTTSVDFSYDVHNSLFSIDGSIRKEENHFDFFGAYQNDAIYIGLNKVKMSIKNETVLDLINLASSYISSNYFDNFICSIAEILNASNIASVINSSNESVNKINLQDGSFEIEIDTAKLNLSTNLGIIKPVITFTNEQITKIAIYGISLQEKRADIEITVIPYSPFELNYDDFTEIEPALDVIEAIRPIVESPRFRMEFDGIFGKVDGSEKEVTVSGGIQYDLDAEFGYGETTIIDRDEYFHNIKFDMTSLDEMLFAYNDTMYGKFENRTINEILDLIVDIIQNPDDHFYEVFGDMIDKIMSTPILRLVRGDIGVLLETDILNSIENGDGSTEIGLPLDVFGISKTMNIEIKYHKSEVEDTTYIDSIEVDNFILGNDILSFSINLKDFEPERENERLNPNLDYLDFSDLKVLLELGIRTSKFDYWHFTATLNLDFGLLFAFDKEVDIDLKIRNNKGDVQIAAELEIPTYLLLNNECEHSFLDHRVASIYYHKGDVYVRRVDYCHDYKKIIYRHDYAVTYGAKMTSAYFIDNALEILLGDLMGFSESMMKKIVNTSESSSESGSSSGEKTQIHYEKILKGFEYNASKNMFTFNIDLKELAQVSMLNDLELVVYAENNELNEVKIKTSITVLITIKFNLHVLLADKDTEINDSNRLVLLEQFVSSCVGEEYNNFRLMSDVEIES